MFLSVVLVLLSVYVSGRNAAGNQQSSMTSNGVPVDACGTHGPYSALARLAPRGAVNSGQTTGVGMVTFSQEAAGQPTTAKGQISGLPANSKCSREISRCGKNYFCIKFEHHLNSIIIVGFCISVLKLLPGIPIHFIGIEIITLLLFLSLFLN